MRRARLWILVACLSAASGVAWAHHSYAMFDTSATKNVSGTVAKLEWQNPHAFLWVYVPSPDKAGKYDLWGFENGSPSVLQGYGWNKDVLKAGVKQAEISWYPDAGHFPMLEEPQRFAERLKAFLDQEDGMQAPQVSASLSPLPSVTL